VCYPAPVFAEMNPRQFFPSSNPSAVPLPHYPPKSLPLNSFADPHPLNPVMSILYKNMGGEGVPPTFRSLSPNSHGIISSTDPHPLNSVASIFYKNIGGRGTPRTFRSLSPSPYNLFPINYPLCVQPLTQCPFCKSFPLTYIHLLGGVYPPPHLISQHANAVCHWW
jgi:hypothetical protein